jgi:hypothetical protein
MSADYQHPASGRTYCKGDPAHRFAQLVEAAAEQAQLFLDHVKQLDGLDYLDQHRRWVSDPDRSRRALAHILAELDSAYTAVVVDRDIRMYSMDVEDDEWQRKYGGPHS